MLTYTMNLEVVHVLLAALATLFTYWLCWRWNHFSLLSRYGIPGPKPNLLTGNIFQFFRKKKTPVEIQEDWIKKYGKVVGYYLGLRPKCLVADMDLLKQICIKEFSTFTNRGPIVTAHRPEAESILPNLRDERWKHVRSVISPTFSSKKMKQMTSIMNECADIFVEQVGKNSNKAADVDIYSMTQGLTLDVIGRCALAMHVDCQRDQNDSFLKDMRNFFAGMHSSLFLPLQLSFPVLRHLSAMVMKHSAFLNTENNILDNLAEVVRKRRNDSDAVHQLDVLQLLLNAAESIDDDSISTKKPKQNRLTDDEIVGNAYVFVIAGYDTTSSALAYTCQLLAKYQDIQEKLYQEIINKMDPKEELSYDSVQLVPYLEQVLYESMRIYPPIPTFIFRECSQDITINGVTFPAGVEVTGATWNIHHDPDIWPDPWAFDPDRFSVENKLKHHPMAFLAFGAGPRNCIGARFAMLEAKLAIVKLLREFRLETGEHFKDPLPLRQTFAFLNPKEGVWVKAVSRQ